MLWPAGMFLLCLLPTESEVLVRACVLRSDVNRSRYEQPLISKNRNVGQCLVCTHIHTVQHTHIFNAVHMIIKFQGTYVCACV